MTVPVLEVDAVTSGYGPVTVLRDVGIRADEAEIVAVLGSNGAGKSTLLKTIVGLLRPASGEIRYNGERIDGRATERIAGAGVVLVPEGRHLFSTMTVRENILLGGYRQRRDRRGADERFARALWMFPALESRLAAQAGSLSGGQQQMVAIARGLMANPKVLLLDEPSLGLAPLVIKEVFSVVGRLRELGVTVILVEQNALLSLGLADRGYVLERGRVTISAPASALIDDPRVRAAYLGLESGGSDSGPRQEAARTGNST